MNKIIKSFTWIFTLLILLTSCNESAIDPLTGKYPVPESYSLSNLIAQKSQKQDKGLRIFTLKLATDGISAAYNEASSAYSYSGTGKCLSIDLVGKDYYPYEGSYAITSKTAIKAMTFVSGYDSGSGTCFSDLANGKETALMVVSGTIYVKKTDNTYSISGTLTLSDLSVIRVAYSGQIIYEPDPEPVKPIELSNLYAASAQTQTGGYQLITLKISTSGVAATYNPTTYSYTYTGTGNYISIDLLSNSTTIDPGTYTAADNGAGAAGNFIKGYDTEMWGMKFYNWGSCWFSLENGVETPQHIIDGTVVVAQNGSVYTITVTGKTASGDDILAEYKGQIIQLNGGDKPVEPEHSYRYTNTTSAVSTYDFATGKTTVYDGVTMNKIIVTEESGDTIAAFEAITASDATNLEGDYSIAENPTQKGQMNNGWSIPDYKMSGGSFIYLEEVKWYLKKGTVTIKESSDGILQINGNDLTIQDDNSNSKTNSFSLSDVKQ